MAESQSSTTPPSRNRPPASTRRPPASPTKIPSGVPLAKLAPYAAAVLALVVLVVLLRNPALVRIGALSIGVVVAAALGYVGIGYRISLPPQDRMRVLLPIVTAAVMLAALVPFAYTLFPPPPRGSVALSAPGDAHDVDVEGSSATVWVAAEASFVHGATGVPSYAMTVTRAGAAPESVEGTIHPHAGAPLPDRHVLSQRGPARFTLRLDDLSSALRPPLRVSVHTRPFSTLSLALIYGLLAVVVVVLDALLWKRGVEPSYAAAMILPLVAVAYFQRRPIDPDTLRTELLAAAAIGAIAGGLGGELLGRVGRMFVKR